MCASLISFAFFTRLKEFSHKLHYKSTVFEILFWIALLLSLDNRNHFYYSRHFFWIIICNLVLSFIISPWWLRYLYLFLIARFSSASILSYPFFPFPPLQYPLPLNLISKRWHQINTVIADLGPKNTRLSDFFTF